MKVINQYLEEAILFNEKDTQYRLEEWKKGHIKNLYILGYLGSGKSTTSKELAKQYKATLIELDVLREEYVDKLLKDSTSPEDEEGLYDKFIEHLKKIAKKTTKRIIYEGIDVLWIDRKLVLSQSVIIKGTSALISTWRAWKRDLKRKASGEDAWYRDKTKFQMLKDVSKNQKFFTKHVNKFRKELEKSKL